MHHPKKPQILDIFTIFILFVFLNLLANIKYSRVIIFIILIDHSKNKNLLRDIIDILFTLSIHFFVLLLS